MTTDVNIVVIGCTWVIYIYIYTHNYKFKDVELLFECHALSDHQTKIFAQVALSFNGKIQTLN